VSNIKNKKKKLVAIAVPLSNREGFTEEEKVSLQHLNHFLGKYDRFFIAPPNLNVSHGDSFRVKVFEPHFFGSVEAHRRLLFSKTFYQSFSNYKYLMIYHLDALVFSDQLEYWCRRGFDYIAPPWIAHKDAPYSGMPDFENKVGNGGFSLRNIEAILKVLGSWRYRRSPAESLFRIIHSDKIPIQKLKAFLKTLHLFVPWLNGIRKELDTYRYPEDHFWANRAVHYNPEFKIASVFDALPFAFECVPSYCYEKNNYNLPFGCHAWERYEKDFWLPFLHTR
jgi:hypothetical protein